MSFSGYGLKRVKEYAWMGILPALAIVLLISLYPLLRYGGWWNVGNDTLNVTIAIRSVLDTGELVPVGRKVYPNGYGFPALSVFLLNLGGFDLPEWQIYGAILLITWMVFPAWILYREWVGSNRGATLATIFLFVQPELLFGIMRGTHEKFTRGLILFCLFLITYSLRSRNNPGRFAASVVAFYLAAFALISFNSLFSSSFILAVLLALGLVWALARWTKSSNSLKPTLQRLVFILVILLVLAFLYIFYVYSPAKQNLMTIRSVSDRISALFLEYSVEETFNPYSEPVFRAWVSPYVFLLLSLANWLLLISSGIIWTSRTARWLRRREFPPDDVDLLQWSFYGAFALVLGITVLADISGALSGNLQHRMFPMIGFVGAPLIARWVLQFLRTQRRSLALLVRIGLWAVIGLLSLLSLIKATNEPIFSNRWQTYLPGEVQALDWAEGALANRSVWIGFDRRIVEVILVRSGATPRKVFMDRFEVDPGTDNYLVSGLIRLQVPRLKVSLPVQPDDYITFDNGQAQIYHRRPQTPYQR